MRLNAWLLVLSSLTACSAAPEDPGPNWTTDDECMDGLEGCPCINGQCLEPYVCYEPSDVCIEPMDASESGESGASTNGDSTASGDGDSTTNGDGDGDSTTNGDGDSTTNGDGDSTTNGDGDSTTNGDGDGDTGEAGSLDVLERCDASSECLDTLACVQMDKSSSLSRCVPTCISNPQCPTGTRCIDVGGEKRCRGNDIGKSCSDANACNFACLTTPGYCTDSCSTGADCPNGYGCMGVGSPSTDVCVKVEAMCTDTDASECVVSSACDTSPSLILGGCTQACDTAADCPQRAAGLAAWTCDGLCRRPADVYGSLPGGWTPVEYHCDAGLNTVNLCNDAQHIDFDGFTIPAPPNADCFSSLTTTGSANDSCVNSCKFQGACPDNYACVGVGSVGGQRIGLCLPAGTTETGQNCTTHTQCEFGYCVNGSCSRDCSSDGICTAGTSCVAGGSPAVEGLTFMRCE
jgi:hypothetical protein